MPLTDLKFSTKNTESMLASILFANIFTTDINVRPTTYFKYLWLHSKKKNTQITKDDMR